MEIGDEYEAETQHHQNQIHEHDAYTGGWGVVKKETRRVRLWNDALSCLSSFSLAMIFFFLFEYDCINLPCNPQNQELDMVAISYTFLHNNSSFLNSHAVPIPSDRKSTRLNSSHVR